MGGGWVRCCRPNLVFEVEELIGLLDAELSQFGKLRVLVGVLMGHHLVFRRYAVATTLPCSTGQDTAGQIVREFATA